MHMPFDGRMSLTPRYHRSAVNYLGYMLSYSFALRRATYRAHHATSACAVNFSPTPRLFAWPIEGRLLTTLPGLFTFRHLIKGHDFF